MIQALGQKVGYRYSFENATAIFDEISQSEEAFRGMNYAKLGTAGMVLNGENANLGGAYVG